LAALPAQSELAMMAAMGLPVGFDTTQGVGIEDNEKGAAYVVPKRKYRQFMNTKKPRIPGQGAPPRNRS
jgi:U4/U6.U5 small nuclear ribonucleoproteins